METNLQFSETAYIELKNIEILQRLGLRRAMSEETTIFDKILDGSIPATFIHQDDKCVAFNDVAPQVSRRNLQFFNYLLTLHL